LTIDILEVLENILEGENVFLKREISINEFEKKIRENT